MQVCALAEFLLDIVSLETNRETPKEHLPSLFHHLVVQLTEHCDSLSSLQVARGLKLCAKILTRVQPSIVSGHNITTAPKADDTEDSSQINSDNSSLSEIPVDEGSEKTDSVFEQCLRQYEKFYVFFIYLTRLKVGETRSISLILESLRVKSAHSHWEEDAKQIELTLCSESANNNERITYTSSKEDSSSTTTSGKEWVEPMKTASRLLVDLSTLQTFFQSPQSKKMFECNATGMLSFIINKLSHLYLVHKRHCFRNVSNQNQNFKNLCLV